MPNVPTEMNQPVIDLELGLQLAGNNADLARDMLLLMTKSLPADFDEIKVDYLAKNFNSLQQRLHKLHGALCYCGLPRLKLAVNQFETALKKNDDHSYSALFLCLENETLLVLEQIKHIQA